MRRKDIFLLFFSMLLFAALAGCSTLRVSSDYNPSFAFSKLKTFAILYDKHGNSPMQQRIVQALTEALVSKGYKPAPKDKADFFVVFHTNIKNKRQVVTDYQRVGLYPYGFGTYAMVPIQREYEYKEGKIIVDALDPKTKNIFWRGIATDRLKSFKDPAERMKYAKEVAEKLLKSFPPSKL